MICQLRPEPTQILSYNSLSVYNSLSAAIHLYMIWLIDLKNVLIAKGWDCAPMDMEYFKGSRFFYIQHLKRAHYFLKIKTNDRVLKSQYPKGFDFGDIQKLLGTQIYSGDTLDFRQWKKQNRVYKLNDPLSYLRL